MKYTKTLLAIVAMATLTISCSDEDYFDKAAYDKLITEAFPVSDVDPDHDWQTISAINVNVTLAQSGEGESSLRIYDGYPTDSTAYLLATTTMANGETYTTTVNCSQGTDVLYLVLTTPNGYTSIYPKMLSDNSLETTIGDEAPAATTKTRAAGATRATINNYTFADNISDSEYTKAIPSSAKPLPSDISGSLEGEHCYYVAEEGNVSLNFGNNENIEVYFPRGSYTLTGFNISNNGTIYLLEGAVVTIKDQLTFQGSTNKIIVEKGATFSTGKKVLYVTNQGKLYNRGTITGKSIEMSGDGSLLYNDQDGEIELSDQIKTSNTGVQVVNYGNITVPTIQPQGMSYNIGKIISTKVFDMGSGGVLINDNLIEAEDFQVVNGSVGYVLNRCKIIADDLFVVENNSVDIEAGASLKARTVELKQNSTLKMGSNSLVYATNELKLYGYLATVEGSSEGFALLRVKTLKSFTDNQTCMKGNLICCYGSDDGFHMYDTKKNNYYQSTHFEGVVKLSKGLNSQDVTIAASGCSDGYSAGSAMDTGDLSQNTQKLRYCYEDQFPSPGDYDFNDCVIDITSKKVNDTKATYKVELVAVGATKQIAAALRLKGIKYSDISSVEISGDLFDLNKATSSINSDLIKQKFTTTYTKSASGEDAVIYLFNDAHYAFTNNTSSTGSVSRPFINTVKDPEDGVLTLTSAPISCEITVEFNSNVAGTAVGETCMDLFIVTEYNGGKWEIHTRELQNSPALYDYDVSAQYDINLPWALCLPSTFKYPKEWTSIGSDKNGEVSGAYITEEHSFVEWCKDKTSNKDWYNHPVEGQNY